MKYGMLSFLAMLLLSPKEGEGGGTTTEKDEKEITTTETDEDVKFSPAQQKKVDQLISANRKSAAEKELKKVETALKDKDLTDKEVARLKKTQEELTESLEGEKASATRKANELKEQHDAALGAEKKKTSTFERKFKESELKRQLRECKEDFGVKDTDQIREMIEGKIKVTNVKDENGVSIDDEYMIGIETEVSGGEGKKKIKKVLSVIEYVKLMSENPKNDNLFLTSRQGGTGKNPPRNGKGGGKLTSAQKIARGMAKLQMDSEGS